MGGRDTVQLDSSLTRLDLTKEENYYAIGQIFIVSNRQKLNRNLAIWSHWWYPKIFKLCFRDKWTNWTLFHALCRTENFALGPTKVETERPFWLFPLCCCHTTTLLNRTHCKLSIYLHGEAINTLWSNIARSILPTCSIHGLTGNRNTSSDGLQTKN